MEKATNTVPTNNNSQSNSCNNSLNLRIASINANSIVSHAKRYELLNFANTEKPDIILVSEIKLNKKHNIQFSDYDIIRTDRPGSVKGGGTAILVKNTLCFSQIFSPSSHNNEILEYTIIKINLKNNYFLYIISIYANNESRNIFIAELEVLFTELKLSDTNNYYLIAGDLNARNTCWGDHSFNFKGRLLKEWYDQYSHQYKLNILSPDSPTYTTANTVLDLCLIDVRITVNNLKNNKVKTADFDSDHKALIIDIFLNNKVDDESNQKIHRCLFKKTKWGKFATHLHNNLNMNLPDNRNLSTTEIDNAISHITSKIQQSIESVVPKYKPQSNTLLYVNSKIKKMRAQKSKLITILNRNRQNNIHTNTRYIKTLIEDLNIKLKSEFRKAYTAYWDTLHKTINHRSSTTFFPKINRWFRPKKPLDIEALQISQDEANTISKYCDINKLLKKEDVFIINNPIDKLNIIGSFYEKINSARYTNTNTLTKATVTQEINRFKQNLDAKIANNETVTKFTSKNLSTSPNANLDYPYFCTIPIFHIILKSLPNKSSSGLDNIPPIVLKHLPIKAVRLLVIIFNNALNHNYFPQMWKCAKILPILKKNKNPNSPTSYRPISLTSSLSKTYEILIDRSISFFCNSKKIIPDTQFGFQPKMSTVHAINRVIDNINSHLHSNEVVGACLIDIEKAFDSAWIDGLIYILIVEKFPLPLIQSIFSTITQKTFVIWDGKITSNNTFVVEEGLQQGSVISPKLFNILTKSVLKFANANTNQGSYSTAYADDLMIYVGHKDPKVVENILQNSVNEVDAYYREWNLRISPGKCELIVFHKPLRFICPTRREKIKNFKITYHNKDNNIVNEIKRKQNVRYLGVTLDYLLKLNIHVQIQLSKASNSFKSLYRLFFNKNIEPRAKVILYMLLIRPILTYAAPV